MKNKADELRHVIIHGDCWPVVSATEHVVKALLPESRCESVYGLRALLQQLSRTPEALLILCLRPREHIFLFYALKNELLRHPALVISDELLFSDRVVLHNWGDIPAVFRQDLSDIVDCLRYRRPLTPAKGRLGDFLSDPKPATGFFTVPVIFNRPKRLMNYMSLLMYRATASCGLTPAQQKLLQEVHCGKLALSDMTGILNSGKKKIWQDKNQILIKLGMRNRLRELLYGTRFCMAGQQTAFMIPEDTEQGQHIP
ncbi:TPA: transcriptional regulator [Salmonella enterica subsp. enterica serovar Stanley]|nr:transcriptional regulator [Salmonella enterica subsp. enterica serovar Stanley]